MAQDEQSRETTKKKAQNKDKEKMKKEKPPSKVIIRRLPPTMTEEEFLEQISPLPENDFFYFVKGEQHIGVPTFSRAYINFLHLDEIFTFQEKFDGYVFLDQKGTEYLAVVEFAPYQRIPRQEPGAKEDKCNTIDNDPHYLQFLKKLEQPEDFVLPSAESYLEQLELREREIKANGYAKITTPLVEFIQQRRIDREKYREEKKDERRRKELEKKKQRELERMNKKRESKKDDKKSDKQITKGRKEADDRPSNPVKVLRNTERETLEKAEKPEAGTVLKKQKENTRAKVEKPKEKQLNREKPKAKTEKRPATESNDSNKPDGKQEAQQLHQPKTKTVSSKEETVTNTENSTGAPPRLEEEKGSRRRTENESTDKEKKIRNKDRPAIQIYRPGAKRMNTQKSDDTSITVTPPPTAGMNREMKTRTFTRNSERE